MAGWTLVPCLVALRSEFTALAPTRDKSSDGAIGDTAHAQSSSDHNPDETGATPSEDTDSINEVHAIDVDNTGPWPAGITFDKLIQIIVERHRTGQDDRLQNVIWNRKIWSRSWGWTARAYTGASPHTEHAHFSARYTTAQENDTRPWGLTTTLTSMQGDDDTMAGITIDQIQAAATNAFLGVLADGYHAALADAAYKAASPERQKAMRFVRDTLQGIVGGPTEDDIAAAQVVLISAVGSGNTAAVNKIVQGVLTGLPAAQIAQAVVAAMPTDQAKRVADELRDRLAA